MQASFWSWIAQKNDMATPFKLEIDDRAFIATLQEYQRLRKKTDEEVVVDRAGKVAIELFKKFAAITPSVATLRSVAESLNWRLRRPPGTSAKSELRRRIAARFAASAGWLPAVWKFTRSGRKLKKIKNPRGSFIINRGEPSVTILNSMREAVAAEEKYVLVQAALDAQVDDMRQYIERKLDEQAKRFSAK